MAERTANGDLTRDGRKSFSRLFRPPLGIVGQGEEHLHLLRPIDAFAGQQRKCFADELALSRIARTVGALHSVERCRQIEQPAPDVEKLAVEHAPCCGGFCHAFTSLTNPTIDNRSGRKTVPRRPPPR